MQRKSLSGVSILRYTSLFAPTALSLHRRGYLIWVKCADKLRELSLQ